MLRRQPLRRLARRLLAPALRRHQDLADEAELLRAQVRRTEARLDELTRGMTELVQRLEGRT